MKYILLMLFLGASVVSAAIDNNAQLSQAKPYVLDTTFQKMQVAPQRAEQVKKILIENRAKRREIMEAARKQVELLQAATEQQIADVLTAEELQAYDQTLDAQQQVFKNAERWHTLTTEHRTAAQQALPPNDVSKL
ncbi:MAG: hypothetical protein KTR17_02290 [Cellvibrionaceae bacterium]|nr:hypothetical protein [Cellvibrionaceae bacterium]